MRAPTPMGARRGWLRTFERFRTWNYDPLTEDNLRRAIRWAHDEEEKIELLQALQRLEEQKRKPGGDDSRKKQIDKELLDGYAGFFQTASSRPYCTDNLAHGQKIRPLGTAVKMRLIQPNPLGMLHWLVYDIDRPDASDAWRQAGLREPQLTMVNPSNGHAHAAWRLAAPVCTTSAARAKPMQFAAVVQEAMRLALGADPGYVGGLVKNPAHPAWRTFVNDVKPYALHELAAGLDLRRAANDRARDTDVSGLGRNCEMFENGRQWAYGEIAAYWGPSGHARWYQAVLEHLKQLNGQYPEPLPLSEVAATAKSIARWTWRHITPAGRAALIERTHTSERQSQRGRLGGRPSLGEPWEALGISRRTYFRRRKAGTLAG